MQEASQQYKLLINTLKQQLKHNQFQLQDCQHHETQVDSHFAKQSRNIEIEFMSEIISQLSTGV